jgi:2-C-methyl-D-erythritol 4-phosphate cytidylyltransferase/2-C-methyl-D-erythritol 2,4-cyclodiphosphate synthase
MSSCAALVVAAGRGSRFGGSVPKQYADLAGQPVIRHTLWALLAHPEIVAVQPVIHPDDHALFADAAKGLPVLPAVFGGATRQESVRLGLSALSECAPDLVLVHDGARPRVAAGVIDRVVGALKRSAAGVIPVIPVSETLKRIDTGSRITETVARQNIVRAQTPQGFQFAALKEAHERAAGQSLTDDAAVMEASGHPVMTVAGDIDNIKITGTEDLLRVAELMRETRTGIGFDVHRFGSGDGITLGGVLIPMDKALVGHSDADVVLHAATDAILGALGDGDIGLHFPPSDPAYKGAPSRMFLEFAMARLRTQAGELKHLDITVICERPKISPLRDALRASIAEIAGVTVGRVSVKATTTEGLGFTGRGEGIACQALATVQAFPISD